MASAIRILVVHGPNLNQLGTREPQLYGTATLAEIDVELKRRAAAAGATIESFQSNHEGELIDKIHAAKGHADGILINPGGYTHTSVALADALAAIGIPAVEVHLSNLYRREAFRRRSYCGAVCRGTISGLGAASYYVGLIALLDLLAV